MTIDPKLAKLAQQLGALLRNYAPDLDAGHDTLEIFEAFRKGLNSGADHLQPIVELPVCRDDDDNRMLPLDLNAPETINLMVSRSCLFVEPNNRGQPFHIISKNTNRSVTLKLEFGQAGDTFIIRRYAQDLETTQEELCFNRSRQAVERQLIHPRRPSCRSSR